MKRNFVCVLALLSLAGTMLSGCVLNDNVAQAAQSFGINPEDITPYIGENGNWWIGGKDTGVHATGDDGKDGSDGQDGRDGVDGQDGKDGQNGETPYIGDNGNWWIGDEDTGVAAEGAGGEHAGEIYTVRFDANGGLINEWLSVQDVEVEWGNSVDLPVPSRPGYSFLGWFNGADDQARPFLAGDPVFTNIHLVAHWAVQTYTITLDPNGGYFSGENQLSVDFQGDYHLPTFVTRNGYVFQGWYYGDVRWDFDGVYNEPNDVNLTAKWEVGVQYTITLDLNGGAFAPGHEHLSTQISVIPGDWYQLPGGWQLFRENYDFQGWYDENDNYWSENGTYNAANGVTLTARWRETTYSVHLNASGGLFDNQSTDYWFDINYHRAYTLPIPKKEGYSFAGWYEGDTLWENSGIYSRKNSVDLVARWEVRTEFTLKLNLNKGTYTGDQTEWSIAYGDEYALPTEGLTRDGYVFAGWYYGESRWDDAGTYPVRDDRTLAAKWMAKEEYKIHVDFKGGTFGGLENDTVVFNNDNAFYGDRPVLPIPTKEGATFDGYFYRYRWQKVADEEGLVNDYPWAGGAANGEGQVEVTLEARWKNGSSAGDTMFLGEYPQSVVEDRELLAQLEQLTPNENGIIECNGGRYVKRSPEFWDDNGRKSVSKKMTFKHDKTYYFAYEPIEWKILENNGTEMTLISENTLDSERFNTSEQDRIIDGLQVYANNYEHSSIRTWLNETFYDTAFSAADKEKIMVTEVDNSPASTGQTPNKRACDNTFDKVFLLAYGEMHEIWTNIGSVPAKYSVFDNENERCSITTDFARVQQLDSFNRETGSTYVALRSPTPDSNGIGFIGSEGWDSWGWGPTSSFGIRPVITIKIA